MIRTESHHIRLRVDTLYEGAMLFIKGENLAHCCHVVNAGEVHCEARGYVVLGEVPELRELLRVNHEGLTEEDQVHWQLQFGVLRLLTVLEVYVGLLHHLSTHIDGHLNLFISLYR